MVIDGKSIARKIEQGIARQVRHLHTPPHLTIITGDPNLATQRYLNLKRERAATVGITVSVIEFAAGASTAEYVGSIQRMATQTNGIIVQLPLPAGVDIDAVHSAIPLAADVDGVHYLASANSFMPPVVRAIDEISRLYNIDWTGKRVALLGQGRLVGQPATAYAVRQGAESVPLTKHSTSITTELRQADIIVAGAGSPGFITPHKLTDGVVLFDAATAEDSGRLRGDADPACANTAALLTPVPGGIGPITVAALLENVCLAACTK
jgi:methylenetetrahydrofolate dehydrogenase (NADP+)/methenyltetrahydrofolate cyclohydrolase